MRPGNLLTTLLILFLLLVLPLVSFGAVILNNSIRLNESNISQNLSLTLKSQTDVLEQNIMTIESKLQEYVKTIRATLPKLNNSPQTDAYVYYGAVSGLLKTFIAYTNSNSFVDTLCLYHPGLEFALSSTMGIIPFDSQVLDRLLSDFRKSGSLVFASDDDIYMFCFYPYSNLFEGKQTPEFILAAKLNIPALAGIMTSGSYASSDSLLCSGSGPLVSVGSGDRLYHENRTEGPFTVDGIQYLQYQAECSTIGCTLYKFIDYKETFGSYRKLYFLMLILIILWLISLGVYSFFIRRVVHEPIHLLQGAFAQIRNENYRYRIQRRQVSRDFQSLYQGYNDMADTLQKTIEQNYTQRLYAMKMELKQLQTQIDPHFLFNSFFNLRHHLQTGDTDTAMEMAQYLGQYFQYLTRNARSELPFAEEYEHALAYLRIQSLRFGPRLQLHVDELPEEARSRIVPRLILQPLVENAFAYGRRTDEHPNVLSLRINPSGSILHVSVEDNGDRLSDEILCTLKENLSRTEPDSTRETTALINIHRRLQLYFGREAGLSVERNDNGGLTVRMTIPLETCPESEEDQACITS